MAVTRAALLVWLIVGAVGASGAAQGQQRREAAAHVHGAGKLDLVIENGKVSIALDAPADDILGFEHAPRTPAQQAKLAAAVAKLKEADKIFRMPAEAGCRLTKAEAGLEQPDPKAKPGDHADFNGSFEFECSAIAKLNVIDLGYFAAFAGASKLGITIVTAKAQATREATKAKTRIDLKGLN